MNEALTSHDGPGHRWLASLGVRGVQLGLERIEAVLERLGNPERGRATVVVAGTNGKGSTVAMLSALLVKAGLRVGTYTSPHVVETRERVRVNDRCVLAEDLDGWLTQVQEAAAREPRVDLTPFEAITAAAHLAFRARGVDVAVLEVGLGGRLDATNATAPDVSVVTELALDHLDRLGPDLASIAREKLAIARDGRPCVVAQPDLAAATLGEIGRNPALIGLGEALRMQVSEGATGLGTLESAYHGPGAGPSGLVVRMGLAGLHQRSNAALALAAYARLRDVRPELDLAALEVVADALADVPWPLRLEVLSERPLVVADGAHNLSGIEQLVAALSEERPAWHTVVALRRDRDPLPMLEALGAVTQTFWLPRLENDRLWPPEALAEGVELVARHCNAVVGEGERVVRDAVRAPSRWEGTVLTGSLHALGEYLQRGWIRSPRLDKWLGAPATPKLHP